MTPAATASRRRDARGRSSGAAGGSWRTAAPLPAPRSEVAAAFRGGVAVVTGFAPGVVPTRAALYLPRSHGWRRLPDVPMPSSHAAAMRVATPRHGLAVASIGNRVHAIGGSPVADLGFSSANEYLDVTP